jgi:hypothetical protein
VYGSVLPFRSTHRRLYGAAPIESTIRLRAVRSIARETWESIPSQRRKHPIHHRNKASQNYFYSCHWMK